MQIYFELLKHNGASLKEWTLYADVTCKCGKIQSLANYRSNNSRCLKCGEAIET